MGQGISLQEVQALAKSGDADAQYALSSALHQRGQFDESLHWLRQAAAKNLTAAQLTLATLLMDGRRCTRDLNQVIDLLTPLAGMQVQANLLLGELYGFSAFGIADYESGLRHLLVAARMGDAAALRQLALLGVCHQHWDLVPALLDAAARRGDAWSSYAVGGTPVPPKSIDWNWLERALPQLAGEIPLPSAERLHGAPLVQKLTGVLHPLVLDSVIKLAAPLVQRSQIVDARTGEVRADPMRNSSHVTLSPRQHDHVLEAIDRCISRVSGVPVRNGEFTQILRYRVGEEFRPHVDYFNESGAGAYQSLADGGQRAQTVLMYLNDDYGGGSTQFPALSLDIKGRCGDMLHFHNLDADGRGHKDSLHSGTPVTAGEKWLLSKWIRSEHYPPRLIW